MKVMILYTKGLNTNIKILTRNVVCELIESIIVSDRQKVDGKWEQSIDIRYRFIGDLLQDEETGVKKLLEM